MDGDVGEDEDTDEDTFEDRDEDDHEDEGENDCAEEEEKEEVEEEDALCVRLTLLSTWPFQSSVISAIPSFELFFIGIEKKGKRFNREFFFFSMKSDE